MSASLPGGNRNKAPFRPDTPVRRATFRKDERLSSRSLIARLYRSGHVLRAPLLRVRVLPVERPSPRPVQIVFGAPRNRFRRAVDRNHIRRLLREAWRMRKHRLYESLDAFGMQLAVACVYTGSRVPSSDQVEAGTDVALKELLGYVRKLASEHGPREVPPRGERPARRGDDPADPVLPGGH